MKARLNHTLLLTTALVFAVLIVGGCSQLAGPLEGDNGPGGTITLTLDFANRDGKVESKFAPPVIDSAVVRVFRPTGIIPEAAKGVAITGPAGSVDVSLNVIAENNKRISVDLFELGAMVYHGFSTGVNVVKNQNTDVSVDAYDFVVSTLTVSPSVVSEGQVLDLSWDSAPGASAYRLQESNTPDFSNIVWESSGLDTVATLTRGPGAHYFRVAPRTLYTTGTYAPAEFGYVLGGGRVPEILSQDKTEVLPGQTVTLRGENLDFPGTIVRLGSVQCEIESMAWDELVVTVPLNAKTDYFYATSVLAFATSPVGTIVDRIAYVSTTGLYASRYAQYITYYPDDTELSGVALLSVQDLDTQDMSVFDIIVVAHDTGTNVLDWGAGVPARAAAISQSDAAIIAIGLGGAAYLSLATNEVGNVTYSAALGLTFYHVPGPLAGAQIFTSPYQVTLGGGDQNVMFCQAPETIITLDIDFGSKPANMNLYASIDQGVERWTLVDFTITDSDGSVPHFFWGYTGDPLNLTIPGADCLSNIVYRLYNPTQIPVPAVSAR